MEAGGNSGDPAADTCAVVTVHIRCSNGSKFSVETSLDVTVAAFKVLVAGNCEVPAEQQRLIYKGRILKDVQTLGSYDLQADHTIHLVRGASPPPSANTASTPTAEVLRSTSGLSTGLDLGGAATVGGAGLGGSLFPGLSSFDGLGGSGVSGLFGSGLPEFEQVQQQLTQNPNIMREIMNMPVIQNLMNNPETMRSLIMNNPQMREIIDRNPDLGHILNDPSTLRQTLEAARNPELMREMMRNSDRAMSNIESSPEGFNMLRRMYETVQEPFLNATSMAGDAGSDLSSNPFSALLVGNQDPTNQTPNSLTTESYMTTGSPAPNINPLPNPWNNNNATGGSRTNNTTSRSTNPSTNPGGAGIDGLAGLGLPELERMVGGLQDSPLISQVLQSPDMSQIMQSILSNPQYLNQILDLNPQIRIMMESNPQLGEMLRNPDFIRQMTSPETMQQQVLDLQQSLLSLQGRQQSTQDLRETVGRPGTPNLGLEFLTSMLGGLGADGLAVPNPTNVPPEQRYAIQLTQLQEMGFFDTQENIRALIASAGNVHAAVERLLGNLDINMV